MKYPTRLRVKLRILFIAALLLLLWQGICVLAAIPEYLLPAPSLIVGVLLKNLRLFMLNGSVTATEALLGFFIANLFAIFLAVLMLYIRGLDRIVMPFAIALKTTPIIAMAPMLLLWLGAGIAPKVAASALICFFPMLVNALKGLRELEEGEEDLFLTYGASRSQELFKLRIWRASPFIFSALKVSSSLSIVGAIVGEFIGADRGIGYVILVSSYHLETPKMFAGLFVASAMGLVAYIVLSAIDRKIIFWMSEPRDETMLKVQ